jgi:hypothetical protein
MLEMVSLAASTAPSLAGYHMQCIEYSDGLPSSELPDGELHQPAIIACTACKIETDCRSQLYVQVSRINEQGVDISLEQVGAMAHSC